MTETLTYHGALLGVFIGDALAMPVHWYYDRAALQRDYGQVKDFVAPKNPHPDSILWRSSYQAPNPKGEILHDQAAYWGQRGIHYHQSLQAGEPTLTSRVVALFQESLEACDGYDADDFLARYIKFMTTPGRHRDTYLEECHRNFFTNLAQGRPLFRCANTEKHIGGLPHLVPALTFFKDREQAKQIALKRMRLTHPGNRMEMAGELLADLLLDLLGGMDLEQALWARIDRQGSPLLGHPFREWLQQRDEEVIGRHLSPACYVEDAVPATLYLALKYHDDPEKGLIVNTNLGGDNVHRGAVLGALYGAAYGPEAFPPRWRSSKFFRREMLV